MEKSKVKELNAQSYYQRLPEHIIPVTEYQAWKKPITVRCLRCGRTHTYSQAKYAVLRKCHGCYLLDIREDSLKRLQPILETCGFTLVCWDVGDARCTIRCTRCGDEFDRKADDVIRRGSVACRKCIGAEIKNATKEKHKERKLKGQKERDEKRRDRMRAELNELLGKYVADYDVVRIDDNLTDLWLRHKRCGHEFHTAKTRLKKGYGCAICSKRGISKGAQEIENFLNENGIEYEREKRFEDCRRKKPLPFDFFIPSNNLLIEYNGEQHYRATEMFGGEKKLELYMERDKIKRQFAKENGYRLLIIPWFKDPIPLIRDAINRE